MILPGLYEFAVNMQPNDGMVYLQRNNLCRAARDGYYTHQFRPGVSTSTRGWLAPQLWYRWCRESRHPPVEVFLKVKWSLAHCRAGDYYGGGRLNAAGINAIAPVLRGMQARGKEGRSFAHGGGPEDSGFLVYCDGPTKEDGPACAAALVDLLNEWLIWPDR